MFFPSLRKKCADCRTASLCPLRTLAEGSEGSVRLVPSDAVVHSEVQLAETVPSDVVWDIMMGMDGLPNAVINSDSRGDDRGASGPRAEAGGLRGLVAQRIMDS